jgi:hypothetical protein
LVDYKSAADDFENARRLDPSRLDGMEVSGKAGIRRGEGDRRKERREQFLS